MSDELPDELLADEPEADRPGEHDPATSRWRQRPSAKRVVVAVGVVLALYYLVTLVQVVDTGRNDSVRPADAIVVLGAAQYDGRPSPQLAARLDHALTLWQDGMAPTLVATGGNQPGDRFTEAEASASYLVERGVPDSAIISVGVGSTTYESLEVVARFLLERDLGDVILVTDPYHSYRSELTAEEVGLEAQVAPTPSSVVTGWTSVRRHAVEAAGIAVGRLVGFDRLSDLTG